jgi:hypothetical protein
MCVALTATFAVGFDLTNITVTSFNGQPAMPALSFTPGTLYYAIATPGFINSNVTIAANFSISNAVTLNGTSLSPNIGVTVPLLTTSGSTIIYAVWSPLDTSQYVLAIKRTATQVSFSTTSCMVCNTSASVTTYASFGASIAGKFVYPLQGTGFKPAYWNPCSIKVAFTTPGTVSLYFAATGVLYPLTTGVSSPTFSLPYGLSEFNILSTLDGNYTFTFTRNAWIMTGVNITATMMGGAQQLIPLSPPYIGGTFTYTAVVGWSTVFISPECQFTVCSGTCVFVLGVSSAPIATTGAIMC